MNLHERITLMLRKVQRLRQSPQSISTPLGDIPYSGVHVRKCYNPRVDDTTYVTQEQIAQGIARLKRCLGHDDETKCEVCDDDTY